MKFNVADFGTGRKVDLSIYGATGYLQNDFTIGKAWTASLSSWYNSPSIFRGTMKTRYLTAVNAGVQKVIMKAKGNLRLNFNDIFKTINWYGTSNFAGQYLYATAFWDPRNVTIGFSYKFGNNKVKATRQHTTGIDEESKRAGNSSGNNQ